MGMIGEWRARSGGLWCYQQREIHLSTHCEDPEDSGRAVSLCVKYVILPFNRKGSMVSGALRRDQNEGNHFR